VSLRISVLGSGSGGNCTLVATECTRLLVDAGFSRRDTMRRLAALGESTEPVDAILISHEHSDHISGLTSLVKGFSKQRQVPVFVTEITRNSMILEEDAPPRAEYQRAAGASGESGGGLRLDGAGESGGGLRLDGAGESGGGLRLDGAGESGGGLRLDGAGGSAMGPLFREPAPPVPPAEPRREPTAIAFEYIRPGCRFTIGDIEVDAFTIPHDAADPVAFSFRAQGLRAAVCTDLGYVPESVKHQLYGCQILVLESNHDLEMLKVGPYPWHIKQRVMSRTGHLSNLAVADYLEQELDAGTQVLVLAHLSENNNHPAIARMSAEQALEARGTAPRLVLAAQRTPTEMFRF
jgi:phosphoribosyl 1,2-cyclic phosphodiesterase